jgi:hypothetical protein
MNRKEKIRTVCEAYEAAYLRKNGKPCEIRPASPGWFRIYSKSESSDRMEASVNLYRLADIEKIIPRLEEHALTNETAAKRKGFIVRIAPPRTGRYQHMTFRYYIADGKWTHDRACPTVFVFNGSHEADSVAHELNEGLPFKYAEIEPF